MPGTTRPRIAQWFYGLRTRGGPKHPGKRRHGAAVVDYRSSDHAASVDSDLDSTATGSSSRESSSSCSPSPSPSSSSLSSTTSSTSSLRDAPQVVAIQGVDEWELFLALEKEFGLRGFKINQRADRYEIWAPRDIGEVSGIPPHRHLRAETSEEGRRQQDA